MITPPPEFPPSSIQRKSFHGRCDHFAKARSIWRAATIFLSIAALVGGLIAFAISIRDADAIALHRIQVFWLFFSVNEPVPLLLIALVGFISLKPPRPLFRQIASTPCWLRCVLLSAATPWVAAGAVFLVALGGTFWASLDYPLSMDEFTMDYQAQIFASGQFDQFVAPEWRSTADRVHPLFVVYQEVSHSWYSVYLPVYSAMRAGFYLLGFPQLMNPLLAALSVLLFSGVLRNLWPSDRWITNAGTLLLAISAQFAVTAMTAFPLTAHLFLNLLWLYCFTKQGGKAWLWCPWIGLAAMGLHQPVMHGLFVAPFLVYTLFRRSWWQTAYFAIIYAACSAVWYAWLQIWGGTGLTPSSLQFALGRMVSIQAASAMLMIGWAGVFVPVLALYALARRRFISPIISCGAIGCLLTWSFYWLFPDNQGHGWGYRYFFPVLGNFVLLACAGLRAFEQDFGKRRAQTLLFTSVVLSLGLLGLRCWQVRQASEPYSRVAEYLKAQPVDIVLLDAQRIPYGGDFIRNRPDMTNRPIIIGTPVSAQAVKELSTRHRVQVVTSEDVKRLGY